MIEEMRTAAAIVRERCGFIPAVAVILGSGLSSLAEELTSRVTIPYGDLPGLSTATAPGHASEMVAGKLGGRRVLVLKGRFHLYEGHALEASIAPIRLLRLVGCARLLLTNAAGGVNLGYLPGDLMVIRDHLNLAGRSPLRGANEVAFGPRFPDLTRCWSPEMARTLEGAAAAEGLVLKEGVYGWLTGPSFETPAEIRMARALGADAVGMSTVPEAIAAAHCGLSCAGLSCISNMAAGILDRPITAEEVLATGRMVRESLARLITRFIALLPVDQST